MVASRFLCFCFVPDFPEPVGVGREEVVVAPVGVGMAVSVGGGIAVTGAAGMTAGMTAAGDGARTAVWGGPTGAGIGPGTCGAGREELEWWPPDRAGPEAAATSVTGWPPSAMAGNAVSGPAESAIAAAAAAAASAPKNPLAVDAPFPPDWAAATAPPWGLPLVPLEAPPGE
jgi:hypothetical protein